MARRQKPTTREQRVQKAAKQMKVISICFLIVSITSFFSEKYIGYEKYVFFAIFLFLAILLWRNSKPDILREFKHFDKEKSDKMF